MLNDATATAPVKAVLFDYGLVLSGPPDLQAWERLKDVFAVGEESFHAAYWRHRHDYDRGTLTAVTYWHAVAIDLHQVMSEMQLGELIDADNEVWTQPNPPMIAWAAALQRAGIKTGILSNIGDAMEEGVRDRCGWLAGFAHHTFSHRLGIAKPDAAIYRHAADGLRTQPTEVLFIDDREDNIAAAEANGMQAVRYSDHKSFLTTMRARGFNYLLAIQEDSV